MTDTPAKEDESPKEDMTNNKVRLFDLLIHDLSSPLSIASTTVDNLLHKTERYGPLTDHQRRMIDRILRNVTKAKI
jgi:signal transduction histidine kinase